jgi:alkylation response protein AidB-like acyl-CoA dehydrogenase
MFSPGEVVIEDTWNVSGLSGTGSHHFHVEDVIVPAARTFVPLVDPPCVDTAIVRIPTPALFALGIASVAIGMARGALDEVIRIARERVPLLEHEPVAANPHFHYELAAADADVRAARALLTEVASDAWLTAASGQSFSLEQRARLRASAVWSTERAVAAVEDAYRSGGGSAVYLDSSLQRRLRDIHALTQHFLVKRDTFTTAGAILAGQDVEVMVF